MELLHAKNHAQAFPFHTHPTYNITLILEQHFTTKLADGLLYAMPGYIVITHPGEVHATYCDNRLGSSFFTFYIPPDIFTDLNSGQTVYFQQRIIHDAAIFQKLLQLSKTIAREDAVVVREFLYTLQLLTKKYGSNNEGNNKQQYLFRKFLEEENLEKFSLEKAANQFGLDKYKFLRLFKQQTGLTPNNYIILKRIEKCKALLHGNASLLDIAIETGFYDATHLCRHFKKITGVTPDTYRAG